MKTSYKEDCLASRKLDWLARLQRVPEKSHNSGSSKLVVVEPQIRLEISTKWIYKILGWCMYILCSCLWILNDFFFFSVLSWEKRECE